MVKESCCGSNCGGFHVASATLGLDLCPDVIGSVVGHAEFLIHISQQFLPFLASIHKCTTILCRLTQILSWCFSAAVKYFSGILCGTD